MVLPQNISDLTVQAVHWQLSDAVVYKTKLYKRQKQVKFVNCILGEMPLDVYDYTHGCGRIWLVTCGRFGTL